MAGDALPDALRVRAKLAGLALGLLAVPFALLLLLVSGRWDPLLDLDQGAIEGLHGVALSHGAFVAVLNLISTIGSAWLYLPLFTALSIWLAAQGLRRLAAFVVVTVAREPMLNSLAKRAIGPGPSSPNRSLTQGSSYPGHAQNTTVAAGVLLIVFLPALTSAGVQRRCSPRWSGCFSCASAASGLACTSSRTSWPVSSSVPRGWPPRRPSSTFGGRERLWGRGG